MSQRTDGALPQVLERVPVAKSLVAPCAVRHLTSFGAHIEVPADFDMPETFNMTFDGGRSIRPCRLLWRSFNQVAVEFL
jgi:hypothetical protein